ncbi:excalibur calcium-binding domain-containing protein [Streptomyces cacaoi]
MTNRPTRRGEAALTERGCRHLGRCAEGTYGRHLDRDGDGVGCE